MHDSKIDNAKGLLMILVIFGHVLSRNQLDGINYIMYVLIYTVHMPLMFIISGYLSSSVLKRSFKDNLILSIKKLLIPFIIVSFAYILLSHNLLGYKLRSDIFYRPPFAMWYLLALFFYRIFIKYFMKLKYNLLIALFIWSIATYGPPSTFNHYSLYRIFSFQLYFVIGIHIKMFVDKDKLTFSKTKLALMMISVLAINVFIYQFAGRNVDEFYKLYQYSGKVLSLKYIYPGLKVMSLIASLLLSIVIWNLVSSKKSIITQIGSNSMSYYVIHILLIVIYQRYVFPMFEQISNSQLTLLINIGITVSILIVCKLYISLKGKIMKKIAMVFAVIVCSAFTFNASEVNSEYVENSHNISSEYGSEDVSSSNQEVDSVSEIVEETPISNVEENGENENSEIDRLLNDNGDYYNDTYENGNRIRTYYNKYNKIIQKLYYNASGKKIQSNYYDKNEKLIQKVYYDTNVKKIQSNYYDSKEKIEKSTYYKNDSIYKAKYFASGAVTQSRYYEKNKMIQKVYYNTSGKKIQSNYYETNGKLNKSNYYKSGNKYKTKYFASGAVTQTRYYEKNKMIQKVYYNTSGEKIQSNYYDTNEKLNKSAYYKSGSKYKTKYFAGGVLTQVDVHKKGKVVEKYYYYSNGKLKKSYVEHIEKNNVVTGVTEKWYYSSGKLQKIDARTFPTYYSQYNSNYKKYSCPAYNGNMYEHGCIMNSMAMFYSVYNNDEMTPIELYNQGYKCFFDVPSAYSRNGLDVDQVNVAGSKHSAYTSFYNTGGHVPNGKSRFTIKEALVDYGMPVQLMMRNNSHIAYNFPGHSIMAYRYVYENGKEKIYAKNPGAKGATVDLQAYMNGDYHEYGAKYYLINHAWVGNKK